MALFVACKSLILNGVNKGALFAFLCEPLIFTIGKKKAKLHIGCSKCQNRILKVVRWLLLTAFERGWGVTFCHFVN